VTLVISLVAAVLLMASCSTPSPQAPLSYEAKLRRGETALQRERIFEARKWASEALALEPGRPEGQRLMAKILDREIAREKSLSRRDTLEELSSQEKGQQMKTWFERAEGFLEAHQFDEALFAAEQIFQLDPENPEASRLVDEIKEKARKQGREESLFVKHLYQQEIHSRIQRYTREAERALGEERCGAARLATEKVLLLDPKNRAGERLLALLDEKEKVA